MAKITRIKAQDPGKSPEKPLEAPKTVKKVKVGSSSTKSAKPAKKTGKSVKIDAKATKAIAKAEKKAKEPKKEGNYFKNAWLELRQVRWPSRKATWKMVAAIFIYTGIFIAIIMLLDALFTWLFGLILG